MEPSNSKGPGQAPPPSDPQSAFRYVDDLVAKPVLGSDGALAWQSFRSSDRGHVSAGVAPALPPKRSDRFVAAAVGGESERDREVRLREEGGDRALHAGYEHFREKKEVAGPVEGDGVSVRRARPEHATYFLAAEAFEGWKRWYSFTKRDRGLGYYWDGWNPTDPNERFAAAAGGGENDGGGVAEEVPPATEEGGELPRKKKKRSKKHARIEPDPNNPLEQVAAYIARKAEESLAKGGGGAEGEGRAVPKAAVPASEWKVATDPASNKNYYYNSVTGETRWEDPRAANPEGGDVAEDKKEQNFLSEGWEAATDAASGKMYYFHRASGRTSWEKPTVS